MLKSMLETLGIINKPINPIVPWWYQLQNIGEKSLEAAYIGKPEYLVIEPDYLTAENVKTQQSVGTKVLAYLSVGEAEDYRSYWKNEWATKSPGWLVRENPEWKGNYTVKYWHPEWIKIVQDRLNSVMEKGFDGIYCDKVDGYLDFNRKSADRTHMFYMMDFVQDLSQQIKRKEPGKLVFVQNAPDTFSFPRFMENVDGVGIEDMVYNAFSDGRANPKSYRDFMDSQLSHVSAAYKPVLTVEYVEKNLEIREALDIGKNKGYKTIVTNRGLSQPCPFV